MGLGPQLSGAPAESGSIKFACSGAAMGKEQIRKTPAGSRHGVRACPSFSHHAGRHAHKVAARPVRDLAGPAREVASLRASVLLHHTWSRSSNPNDGARTESTWKAIPASTLL